MTKITKLKLLLDFWHSPWDDAKAARWEAFTPMPYVESSCLTLVNWIMASVEDCDWSALDD